LWLGHWISKNGPGTPNRWQQMGLSNAERSSLRRDLTKFWG
jgi:hypothetical protein